MRFCKEGWWFRMLMLGYTAAPASRWKRPLR
jgi:hypothetical protein